MTYRVFADQRADRYRVTISEYVRYQREGFLVVRQLVPHDEVENLRQHAMDLFYGRVFVPGVDPPPPDATRGELLESFSRVHMLHRVDPVAEQFLLQPRILDVLEALIGPDVLALQTMLFYNPAGRGGQGWHQDAYYITTYPDTLTGAWLAIDEVDEENGCLWIAVGSHSEPIYPSSDPEIGFVHSDGAIEALTAAKNVSDLDDNLNDLSRVAKKYSLVPVPAKPGDVIFAHGHLLHRSHPNRSQDRWRRAFVSHYCNARSWVPWNHGIPYEGDSANYCHILARGTTHLRHAMPRFGIPGAALNPPTVMTKKSSSVDPRPYAEKASASDPDEETWKSKK